MKQIETIQAQDTILFIELGSFSRLTAVLQPGFLASVTAGFAASILHPCIFERFIAFDMHRRVEWDSSWCIRFFWIAFLSSTSFARYCLQLLLLSTTATISFRLGELHSAAQQFSGCYYLFNESDSALHWYAHRSPLHYIELIYIVIADWMSSAGLGLTNFVNLIESQVESQYGVTADQAYWLLNYVQNHLLNSSIYGPPVISQTTAVMLDQWANGTHASRILLPPCFIFI